MPSSLIHQTGIKGVDIKIGKQEIIDKIYMSNEFLVVVFDDKEKEQFITKALPTSLVYAFITDQENSNNEVQQSFIPFPNIGRATAITNKENMH